MSDKKEIIFSSGKELFETKGFKSTNVAAIMSHAGLATGTFYNYFKSKDHLFMEIFMEENAKLKKEIMATLNTDRHPMMVMQEMMMKNQSGMLANPILKEWYNREIFQKIEQRFSEERGIEKVDFLYDSFIEIVRKWQRDGTMRSDISAEMIMAIFTALVNVELHKAEIGYQHFPEVIEFLAEFTMKGLMNSEE